MTILQKKVRTGPPSARHRDSNSFKFISDSSSKNNEISVSAPLSSLYNQSAEFRVVMNNNETLIASINLTSEHLQINETKWFILHLEPESNEGTGAESTHTDGSEVNDQDSNSPTLRLKLCLSGPFRGEIAAILSLSRAWFNAMDRGADLTSPIINCVSNLIPNQLPSGKILLIPAVPIAAATVAILPVVLGVLTVGLPFFLPALVLALAVLGVTLFVGSGLYFSSSKGRGSAGKILGPCVATFLATETGQQLLYETGPRPSPVDLAETVLPTDMIGQLVISLLIDLIGSSSYLLPFAGEFSDISWAPIQTILLMSMYDKQMPSLKYVSFVEEMLPFTDVLPSGTLGWARCYVPLILEAGLKKVPENIRTVVIGGRLDKQF